MRITLTFRLEKDHIVLDTHNFLLSYIKFAFSNVYYREFEQLYLLSPKRKLFTFSTYIRNMKIENGFIISPHKEIKMYISSIDSSLILLIYNSLTKYKYRKMDVSPLNRVWLSEIRLRYLDKVETNEIRIKLLSPLLLRKHDRDTNKDIYVTCEDKMFEQEFNDNIERLCAEFGYSFSKITITSISSRKVITKIMKNSFDATLGTFVLKTENLELLNILYKIGIGSRRSEGFGMFEVLIDV